MCSHKIDHPRLSLFLRASARRKPEISDGPWGNAPVLSVLDGRYHAQRAEYKYIFPGIPSPYIPFTA